MDHAKLSSRAYRINLSGFHLNPSGFLPNLSGILVIKILLDEIENFSGAVPVNDMRTVPGTTVSEVTSLRLRRQQL